MAGRWRTKSVEQSIADTDEPDTQLRKDLSWWHLTVFGVSVVIGAGIFTVTAQTAGDITGPGDLDLVPHRGDHLRVGGVVLRGVRLDAAGGRQRLHVFLRHLW